MDVPCPPMLWVEFCTRRESMNPKLRQTRHTSDGHRMARIAVFVPLKLKLPMLSCWLVEDKERGEVECGRHYRYVPRGRQGSMCYATVEHYDASILTENVQALTILIHKACGTP